MLKGEAGFASHGPRLLYHVSAVLVRKYERTIRVKICHSHDLIHRILRPNIVQGIAIVDCWPAIKTCHDYAQTFETNFR
jgi:hypothetical protein